MQLALHFIIFLNTLLVSTTINSSSSNVTAHDTYCTEKYTLVYKHKWLTKINRSVKQKYLQLDIGDNSDNIQQ